MIERRTNTAEPKGFGAVESNSTGYHRHWRAYAIRWYTTLVLMVTWVPGSVWLYYGSRDGLCEPVTALAVLLLWGVTIFAMVWWTGEFRCPRCRRRYGALGNRKGDTNYTRGFFDKVCANCKLQKFEKG